MRPPGGWIVIRGGPDGGGQHGVSRGEFGPAGRRVPTPYRNPGRAPSHPLVGVAARGGLRVIAGYFPDRLIRVRFGVFVGLTPGCEAFVMGPAISWSLGHFLDCSQFTGHVLFG